MAKGANASAVDLPPRLLITCEHASNDVPPELRSLFRGNGDLLRSHRGWDIGAKEIAERMAAELNAPLMLGRWTRLVVDLNRSPTNRAAFSEITRELNADDRLALLEKYHTPYRRAVEDVIARLMGGHQRVVHLSVHTFTPVLEGKVRAVDIGLLFDPARESEAALARRWKRGIEKSHEPAPLTEPAPDAIGRSGIQHPPALRIRMNQPYRGVSDGLTTHLRTRFAGDRYAGFELEVNQRLFEPIARRRPTASQTGWKPLLYVIARALQTTLSAEPKPS